MRRRHAVVADRIIVTMLFYFVDRYWYHRFLTGTGDALAPLEVHLSSTLGVPVQLGAKIGARSPVDFSRVPRVLRALSWPLFTDNDRNLADGGMGSANIRTGRVIRKQKYRCFTR